MNKYAFRPYSGKFPALFRREKTRLKKLLPKGAEIEHVGSTAVPGLRGKGIIDVLISVDKNLAARTKEKLEKNGYLFSPTGGDKERLFFKKDYNYGKGTRRVHVHLTFRGSKTWRRHLAARDYLRAHPKEAREYERVKKRAAKLCKGEGKLYRKFKEGYMRRLERKALKWRR